MEFCGEKRAWNTQANETHSKVSQQLCKMHRSYFIFNFYLHRYWTNHQDVFRTYIRSLTKCFPNSFYLLFFSKQMFCNTHWLSSRCKICFSIVLHRKNRIIVYGNNIFTVCCIFKHKLKLFVQYAESAILERHHRFSFMFLCFRVSL